jgi:hypothetical protein
VIQLIFYIVTKIKQILTAEKPTPESGTALISTCQKAAKPLQPYPDQAKLLSECQREAFDFIYESGNRGASTVEMAEKGILNASKKVCELRDRGAAIKSSLAPAQTYDSGERHKRVAYYVYLGWHNNIGG